VSAADRDLFDAAARYRTLPAPAASSPTIPVPRPTLAEGFTGIDRRCAELRERARDEARYLRGVVRESGLDLRTADRATVLHHLDHAETHGHVYSVQAALDVLRPYLSREGA
jgi:hypothetical protein